jgi:hypothetical protein
MTDRPTELTLALDAIDDAFKLMVGNFTKDKVEGVQIDIAGGVRKAMAARRALISIVTAAAAATSAS